MIPMERYKFFTNGKDIYAVSSFAKHPVKGKATCHNDDIFSEEKGKELAALRCNLKVAKKRSARAFEKMNAAERKFTEAIREYRRMINYHLDACREEEDAEDLLKEFIKKL